MLPVALIVALVLAAHYFARRAVGEDEAPGLVTGYAGIYSSSLAKLARWGRDDIVKYCARLAAAPGGEGYAHGAGR